MLTFHKPEDSEEFVSGNVQKPFLAQHNRITLFNQRFSRFWMTVGLNQAYWEQETVACVGIVSL